MTCEFVQYGCGLSAPDNWLNFDSSPTLRIQRIPVVGRVYIRNQVRFPRNVRYGDIVAGLPIPSESCKGVFCSHVLEHLALEDCRVALKNTFSYLRPGGVFRLIVPDLEALVRTYISDNEPEAALRFMEYSGLGRKNRARSLAGFVRDMFGNSAHLWMWDRRSIHVELERHGFTAIRQAMPGDAPDLRFNDVEEKSRFVDAVAIQCEKR
jgi:hypothetical protein